MTPLERVAQEFIAYYRREGGCSNCGGVPHSTTCFVGRFEEALAVAAERVRLEPVIGKPGFHFGPAGLLVFMGEWLLGGHAIYRGDVVEVRKLDGMVLVNGAETGTFAPVRPGA